MVVEVLAQQIRNSKHIEGIKIGNVEHKVTQFADDTTCTLRNEISVSYLLDLIKHFTLHSGLRLNIDKTTLLWLGPWRKKVTNGFGFRLERESMNMLGSYVGRNDKHKHENNFVKRLGKMKKNYNIWSSRSLSLSGKILVSKTFGMSNFVYGMTMSEPTDDDLTLAQTETNKFIWGYKPAKIKHKTLIAKHEFGGLKAIDFRIMHQSLVLTWLSRLWDFKHWNNIIHTQLQKYGGLKLLIRCNYDPEALKINSFYKQIFAFANSVFYKPHSINIIWNNKDIRIGSTAIFYRDWFDKGILFIQQLKDDMGHWLSYEQFSVKYNLFNCVFKYVSIINCLKNLIRHNTNYQVIVHQNFPTIDFENKYFKTINESYVDILKVKSKIFYDILLEKYSEEPTALSSWRRDVNITDIEYYNSFMYAKAATKDSNLLSFNYKILNKLLNCRYNLDKWKIISGPYCNLCNENKIDDTVHALVDCNWTCNIVEKILNDLDPDRNWGILLNWKKWIFGIDNPAVNLIILIMKYHIVKSRNENITFSLLKVKSDIFVHILSEKKFIKPAKFYMKWSNHLQLVEKSIEYGKKKNL